MMLYSARIDKLWMCAGKCGLAIGAAYWPPLVIHGVVGSVPTEAWADPQREGICGSPLRGGADCGGRALPTMYLMFAMWPYLKTELSTDNKTE